MKNYGREKISVIKIAAKYMQKKFVQKNIRTSSNKKEIFLEIKL